MLFYSMYSDQKYEKYSGIHRSAFAKWTTPYKELQFNTLPYLHLTKIDPFILTRGHELKTRIASNENHHFSAKILQIEMIPHNFPSF